MERQTTNENEQSFVRFFFFLTLQLTTQLCIKCFPRVWRIREIINTWNSFTNEIVDVCLYTCIRTIVMIDKLLVIHDLRPRRVH